MKNSTLINNFTILIITLLILFNPSSPLAYAKSRDKIRFDHLTIKDGLSDNQTYTILRDRQSFIWIATRYGLSKYDGSGFTNYTHIKSDPSSLSDNFIWHIMEDDIGMLWISTWGGGLNKYNLETDSFHAVAKVKMKLENN